MTNIYRHMGKPFRFPFHTLEMPSHDNIVRYRLSKCPDCGEWFPWFGGW